MPAPAAEALPVVAEGQAPATPAVDAEASAPGAGPSEGGERDRGRRRGRGRGRDREGREDGAQEALSPSEPTAVHFEPDAPVVSEVTTSVAAAPVPAVEPAAVAQAPVPVTAPARPAFVPEAPVVAAVAAAAEPIRIEPYALPTDALQTLAAAAGLEWIASDAEKIRLVQAAMAADPVPVRLPREPRKAVTVDEGPLVLVETRKDLSQLKLPFEAQAPAA
jgi:ribonuclease E